MIHLEPTTSFRSHQSLNPGEAACLDGHWPHALSIESWGSHILRGSCRNQETWLLILGRGWVGAQNWCWACFPSLGQPLIVVLILLHLLGRSSASYWLQCCMTVRTGRPLSWRRSRRQRAPGEAPCLIQLRGIGTSLKNCYPMAPCSPDLFFFFFFGPAKRHVPRGMWDLSFQTRD